MARSRKPTAEPEIPVGPYTAPLGLVGRLTRPELKIDLVPILDLAVIALLLGLLFTRFVALPGVRVDLPKTELRMQHTASNVAILTIGNQGALYFNGGIYERNTIAGGLSRYMRDSARENVVLLIKAQAQIELQLFLDICEMAQTAGFPQVQVIGDRVAAPAGLSNKDAVGAASAAGTAE
ncbi:MAG: ExbD/TolR family protein [Verrucomicrobiota bacterium]